MADFLPNMGPPPAPEHKLPDFWLADYISFHATHTRFRLNSGLEEKVPCTVTIHKAGGFVMIDHLSQAQTFPNVVVLPDWNLRIYVQETLRTVWYSLDVPGLSEPEKYVLFFQSAEDTIDFVFHVALIRAQFALSHIQ